ncbi:MAG: flavin oxidoreductase/NADH oxidase, partial [Clostridia bacterium]|nr:flavin oxidoreductase/NADH oxidase [Clostridia bacterium]
MVKVYSNHTEFLQQNKELEAGLPFSDKVEVLKEPLTVAGKEVKNRLVCQAMEGCDGTPDGRPGELTRRRYRRFAEGGAGLSWFEATAVLPEGRANPRQLYITEQNLDAFKRQ